MCVCLCACVCVRVPIRVGEPDVLMRLACTACMYLRVYLSDTCIHQTKRLEASMPLVARASSTGVPDEAKNDNNDDDDGDDGHAGGGGIRIDRTDFTWLDIEGIKEAHKQQLRARSSWRPQSDTSSLMQTVSASPLSHCLVMHARVLSAHTYIRTYV